MTDHHVPPPPPEEATTVFVDLGRPPYDTPALELRGPLDTARLTAALDHLAVHDPRAPLWRHHVDELAPGHHALRLAADTPDTPADTFPYGRLADLLTHPLPGARPTRSAAATPLQRELLADSDAHPGRHVEQLTLAWHGPLDLGRLRTAWQSVTDRETLLRAAFDDGDEPVVVLHDHVDAAVLWLPHGAIRWSDLVEHDRRRGIDPRLPGPLRVTVLAAGPATDDRPAPARMLLTYHHALLDDWSARLLLREFYRAYLAGGGLPGGERRPDIRDYGRWLDRQDNGPARDFWSTALPSPAEAAWPVQEPAEAAGPGTPGPSQPLPPAEAGPRGDAVPSAPNTDAADRAATQPSAAPRPPESADAPPAAVPPSDALGRTRLRLTTAQTERLGAWAAHWGTTESSVLQAVWALLLYRASGARSSARVRFGVTASGRGILFEGAERLPAALRTALPLSVEVDPHVTMVTLLSELRDRVLDMSGYEWVSPGQIRDWAAGETGAATGDAVEEDGTLLVFESRPRDPDDLADALAAQGVRVAQLETLGARTAFPLTLVAHHDGDGRLVLTASYDRARLDDAAGVLTHSALLLSELPYVAGDSTTVADVLELLSAVVDAADAVAPVRDADSMPDRQPVSLLPPAEAEPPLVPLRAARTAGAGTVCLLQTHGTPRSRYDRLARAYRGPESIVLLRSLPGGTHGRYSALRPVADAAELLVLGAFSGGGSVAYEIARRIAANGVRPPLVVLTGAGADVEGHARMLETAAERAGHPG
ncbi:condensation domain-containing protein [Streptomyces sp. S.PB5]|uniref:condensation domain-containing protein n=1 Tax=Streptomyces sp. S.PB5 TaxID=3020844 RepID=UPI0025AFF5C6|nr:condensation domain-containing protein [Streptomyces sp. S.PB5]MDN3027265.1 condensation domain-containing protein [Streptomyces sp. S.PB5]